MQSRYYVVSVDHEPIVIVKSEEAARDLVDFFDSKVHRGPVSYDEALYLRVLDDDAKHDEYIGDAVGFDACMRTIKSILGED